MKKEDFLIIASGLIILGLIILASFLIPVKPAKAPEEVKIITNTVSYKPGDILKLKVVNNLKNRICFSSCYPYYFEKKNGEEWIDYNYQECSNENLAYYCLDSQQAKGYELIIPAIKLGIHRLGLSACVGCNFEEKFQQNQEFYSNDFEIK